jgi:N-acetylglucosaminyl-diphospho-decaprenol L-rhamnosyltransferase
LRWPNLSLWNIGPLFSNDGKPCEVEVISGACMLVRRNVFERASMFSEDYFMYAEDIDLCRKVKRLGLRNYYVGQAELIHHGGKSSGQTEINQWSTIMKLNAVQKFCVKVHGNFYGRMYRIVMGCAALGRLSVLFLAKAFRISDSRNVVIRRARSKWTAILKWSFGLIE